MNSSFFLRVIFRSWRRNRDLTIATLVTASLAIVAVVTVVVIEWAVWIKPLEYAQPDELVYLHTRLKGAASPTGVSIRDLEDFIRNARCFREVGGFIEDAGFATVGEERSRIIKDRVAANLFSLVGVYPAAGRLFNKAEIDGQAPAVILSDAFWRSRYGGDPSILGKTLVMNDGRYPIVGIMPQGFRFPSLRSSDVWIPLYEHDSADRALRAYGAVGRLREGVSIQEASMELQAVASQLAITYPKTNSQWSPELTPIVKETFARYQKGFVGITALAALFWVTACFTIAGLLLARTIRQQAELSIRVALGADRVALWRQFLTEGVLIGLVSGIAGLILSALTIRLAVSQMPSALPRLSDVRFGWLGIMATILTASTVACIAAVVPQLLAWRLPTAEAIRIVGTRSTNRWQKNVGLLVMSAELAFATVLVTFTIVSLRTLAVRASEHGGFESGSLLTFDVVLPFPRAKYMRPTGRVATVEALLAKIGEIPSVNSVAGTTGFPGGTNSPLGIAVLRDPERVGQGIRSVVRAVTPNYFSVMKIPIEEGHVFTKDEIGEAGLFVVVNRTLADRLDKENPKLRHFMTLENVSPFLPSGKTYQVIGVVSDSYVGATRDPELYIPLSSATGFLTDVVVSASSMPSAATIGGAVRSVERDAAVERIATMAEVLARTLQMERLISMIATLAACFAVSFSIAGVYGILSFSVEQRRVELGLRWALGATRGSVMRLVFGAAMRMAVPAIFLGAILSWALAKASLMEFAIAVPTVGVLCVSGAIVLALVLAAVYPQARRAAAITSLDGIRR